MGAQDPKKQNNFLYKRAMLKASQYYFKLFYQALVTETVYHRHKNRHTDQLDKIRECNHTQALPSKFLTEVSKTNTGEKMASINNGCRENCKDE